MRPLKLARALALVATLTFTSQAMAQRLGTCATDPQSCQPRPQQMFLVALRLLETLVATCVSFADDLQIKSCLHSSEEDRILDRMTDDLHAGRESGGLTFVSEAAHPGFFFLDGQVRVAKTGNNVGDTVYVNTDMISDGSMDIPTAAAILVHELGHHQGIKDHQYLDALGAKIRLLALQVSQSVALQPEQTNSPELTFVNAKVQLDLGITLGRSYGRPQTYVWDGHDYSLLDSFIYTHLCDQNATRKKLTDSWFGAPRVVKNQAGDALSLVTVRFPAYYMCMPDFGIGQNRWTDQVALKLKFDAGATNETHALSLDDLSLSIIDCMKHPDAECRS